MITFVKEKDGKLSFSRLFPLVYAFLILSLYTAIVWRTWTSGESLQDQWQWLMNWGRDFGFVTVMPYVGNQVGKIGNGSRLDA